MSVLDGATLALLAVGVGFFSAGTVALLRFPDVYTRLHAITKVDNLGLGFVLSGLALQAPDVLTAAKLALVWLLTLATSATAGYLVADSAARGGEPAVAGTTAGRAGR